MLYLQSQGHQRNDTSNADTESGSSSSDGRVGGADGSAGNTVCRDRDTRAVGASAFLARAVGSRAAVVGRRQLGRDRHGSLDDGDLLN